MKLESDMTAEDDDRAKSPTSGQPGEAEGLNRWFPNGSNLWMLIGVLWIVVLGAQFWYESSQVQTISYSEFLALQTEGGVTDLRVGSGLISGELVPGTGPSSPRLLT